MVLTVVHHYITVTNQLVAPSSEHARSVSARLEARRSARGQHEIFEAYAFAIIFV